MTRDMNAKSIVVVATMLLGSACAGTLDRHSATIPLTAASEQVAPSGYRVVRRSNQLGVEGAERFTNCEHNTLLRGHGIASYADGSLLVVRYETTADGSVSLTARRIDPVGGVTWTRRFEGLSIRDEPGFELNLGLNGERIADEQQLAGR